MISLEQVQDILEGIIRVACLEERHPPRQVIAETRQFAYQRYALSGTHVDTFITTATVHFTALRLSDEHNTPGTPGNAGG